MEIALFIFGLIGVIASLYAISAYRKEHVEKPEEEKQFLKIQFMSTRNLSLSVTKQLEEYAAKNMHMPTLMPLTPRTNLGASYYWKNYDFGRGWETRTGVEFSLGVLIEGVVGYFPTEDSRYDPDPHRAGVFYVGIGHFRFGKDSEQVRNYWQNEVTHKPNGFPFFGVLEHIKRKRYFQFGGGRLW